MGDNFFRTPITRPPPRSRFFASEAKHLLRSIDTVASFAAQDPVTDVCFSPHPPYELASAHGFSVSLMNPQGGHVRKVLSRFRDRPYSVDYKKDGRLLAVGVGDGTTRVFDVANRFILREFKGHDAAVRNVRFTADGLRVLTASDDRTVRTWDLPTSKLLFTLTDARDHVRAQALSPASQHVWMTGSHDGKARLYDLRSRECVFTLNHVSKIDDVHFLPGGTRAVTIGGPEVRVWDFFAGAKVIAKFSTHAKAVMCGAIHKNGTEFATGGLDGNIKFHDISTFETRGVTMFTSQVLSMDISKDGGQIAAGLADGNVVIRAKKSVAKRGPATVVTQPFKDRAMEGYGRGFVKLDDVDTDEFPGTARYFRRGARAVPSDRDVLVERMPKQKLKEFDRALKGFRLGEAFDLAVETFDPGVVVSVVEELIVRGSLRGALRSREIEDVCPSLEIIKRGIRMPAFTDRLVYLLNTILDMYAVDLGNNEKAERLLAAILRKVKREVGACQQLTTIQGATESIICASTSM